LVLEFPDIEAQFRRGDYNALCFEHLNYFSEASATRLMTQAGFRVVALKKELDRLFYILELENEPKKQLSVENDEELLLYATEKFKDGLDSIVEIIKNAQAQGKTIALHGACNVLNTLFALGDFPEENILIFDGDESKDGMYVPSSTIPCLDAASPRYQEVDLVIIAAMTFYKEIHSFLVSHHGIAPEQILPIFSLPNES